MPPVDPSISSVAFQAERLSVGDIAVMRHLEPTEGGSTSDPSQGKSATRSISIQGRSVSFGPFRFFAKQRLLLEDDTPVCLGSRAFDILTVLVERAGEIVGKEELIARVWPRTFVEEANLKTQVSFLRHALHDGQTGHRYLITVPGRGYAFVAPVHPEEPGRSSVRSATC